MKTRLPLLLAFFGVVMHSLALPGDLDASFGAGGIVNTFIGGGVDFDSTGKVAIQSDGKILVAGGIFRSGAKILLARYIPGGSLDTSFNGTFIVLTDSCKGYDVAIQSDGKILVSGYYESPDHVTHFMLARYTASGSPDPAFNGTGKVIDGPGTGGFGHDVVVQSDGKILAISGYNSLVRYNASGSPDTSFNGAGFVMQNAAVLTSMAVQSDGKILLTGYFGPIPITDIALLRYNGDGSPDTTFNGTGRVNTDLGGDDFPYSVAVQGDGKILVAGSSNNGSNGGDFALVRYNGNGSLDTTFNGTGLTTAAIAIGDGYDIATSVAVQGDGKIVVAGYTFTTDEFSYIAHDHVAVLRYAANGSLDTAFKGTGKVSTQIAVAGSRAYSVALQNDGKIVIGGYYPQSVLAVRYEGGPFSNYDQWKLSQFNNVNVPDLGDADRDGIVNLAEYALHLSPTAPSLPPPAERHLYAEGERLRMFFTRDPASNDVTLEVQSADSPAGPWTTVAASTLGGVTTGPGYIGGDDATPGLKTVEVRDTVNISPTTASRYLRVKVTH